MASEQDESIARGAMGGNKRKSPPPTEELVLPAAKKGLSREDDESDSVHSEGEEERRLAEKREYNRRNSARARQRVKERMTELTQQVFKLEDKLKALEGTNSDLMKKVSSLTEENENFRKVLPAVLQGASQQQANSLPSFLHNSQLGMFKMSPSLPNIQSRAALENQRASLSLPRTLPIQELQARVNRYDLPGASTAQSRSKEDDVKLELALRGLVRQSPLNNGTGLSASSGDLNGSRTLNPSNSLRLMELSSSTASIPNTVNEQALALAMLAARSQNPNNT